MSTSIPAPANRRQVLAAMAMGGSGLALALAGSSKRALAEEMPDYSSHPLTGVWLAMANPALPETPQYPAPGIFTADGMAITIFPVSDVGPGGPMLQSGFIGVWEPYDERTGHMTVVTMQSSLDGVFLGSVTIDGFPRVSDDDATFEDDLSLTTVTIRDASGAIVQQVPPGAGGRPVTAIRMAVDAPGFPEADASPAATPAS